jgi:superfamily II DNA/RNA helicase
MGQAERERVLTRFREGTTEILVATDVAARGIDVEDVTHVINYQCVEDEKIYLHRVGRTGRAGNKGTAVTFVDWDDMPRWGLINKALGLSVPEPVETYSSSPHLYTDLDIPEGTKGRLPRDKRTLAGVDAEVLEDLGETGKKNSRSGGGRDAGRTRDRDGRDRDNRGREGRSGNREGGRTGGDTGRSGERRRRTSDAAESPAAAGEAPAATETEQPSRTRRPRTRTRRRNGEVVAGDKAAQPGSTEA